ncbi:nucleoside monophosphate kinase [Crocosphaera sp. UHCC 0190]|uniref:adenylate kinase family protein n=1 Tax=Crocosphaera sp. UHCC 0190 TaxID=3110246 RepID=UPI002B1F60C5|nr:nucleoside monophosphate kinase [Crocosphaera sp. UHCC 0190]MEA5511254.1 nucleoside monophosphate kinase [Crocosphaera sp. UHCC 0190]
MRLVILGGPGSGKGTQAKWLSDYFKIPMISTGNILRNAISEQTQLGKKAQDYVEKGELLPNEIMIEFMREHLEKNALDKGWILEGYPRTAFQAEELDFLLETLEQKLNYAIYLEVSEPVMKQRSLRRSLMDDQPEIIEHRINIFKQYTIPLLDYYQGTKRLLTIAGEASTDEVGQEILSKIIH